MIQAGSAKKFVGIDVPEDLTRTNFFNLYFSSWIMACLMALPAVIQPAFLKEIIGIPANMAGSLNAGLQNMGQLSTLFLIGLVGIASDKYGRKVLVVWGFILCFIFYIIFGNSMLIARVLGMESVAGRLVCAYVIRFMIGIGIVMSHPQFVTLVADYTFVQSRGKAMALHAVMMSLGTLCVYGIFTRFATQVGILGLFYTGGLFGLLGFVVAQAGLVDRLPPDKKRKNRLKEAYQAVSKSFPLKVSYIAGFITRSDIAVPSTILMVWMVNVADKFGYTPVQATARGGIILMVGSLFSLISFSAVGILLDRIGRVPVLIVTLFIAGIAYFLIASTENPFSDPMFLYVCLLGFGKNGAIVAANTLASDAAPKPVLGSVLGGQNTLGTLGILLFMQLSGYLFDNFSCQSPFFVKGAVDLLCGVWIFTVRGRILSGLLPDKPGRQ